jgi:hypothetical protein
MAVTLVEIIDDCKGIEGSSSESSRVRFICAPYQSFIISSSIISRYQGMLYEITIE